MAMLQILISQWNTESYDIQNTLKNECCQPGECKRSCRTKWLFLQREDEFDTESLCVDTHFLLELVCAVTEIYCALDSLQ